MIHTSGYKVDTYVEIVDADVLVESLNDHLDGGHDDQLRQARLAHYHAQRDEDRNCAKVGGQQT